MTMTMTSPPGTTEDAVALAAKMFPTTVTCLHAVARLGVAAVLDDGPTTLEALARRCGTAELGLAKVLQVLAHEGIFRIGEDGRVEHTAMSSVLSPAHPRSLHAMALLIGDDWLWRCWNRLPDSVRSGRPAFMLEFGESAWTWLPAHPEAARTFHDAMASFSTTVCDQLVAAFPLRGQESSVCDLGGGTGAYLAALLRHAPHLQTGVVLDAPGVVEQAMAAPTAPDLMEAGRLTFQAGSFLEAVPSADLYVAKQILHSWRDEDVRRLLSVVRTASPAARLVLAEFIGERGAPRFAHDFDLTMYLTMPGAVRTAADLAALASAEAYSLTVHRTDSTLSLLELTPTG